MNISESLAAKGGKECGRGGQEDHREPHPRAEQGRQLDRPPLHHRPHLLHLVVLLVLLADRGPDAGRGQAEVSLGRRA